MANSKTKFSVFFFIAFVVFFEIKRCSCVFANQKNDLEDCKNLKKISEFLKVFKTNTLIKMSDDEISEKMIAGFLKEIDQYGNFFKNENEYKIFNERLRANYNGIGVFLKKNSNNYYIHEIQHNSIAQKSGLQAGDIIDSINHLSPKKEGLLECEIDKNLDLRVIRPDSLGNLSGAQKTFNILLSCENLKQENFEFRFLDHEVALLKIYTFAENISIDIDEILNSNKIFNLKSLIIDLRNNGGGLRDEAVNLASRFLEKKSLLFSVKNQDGKIISKFDSKPELFSRNSSNLSLAILVNKNSASASEIFAASLRENKRAIIIGQKTFGKGVGQQIFPLENGKFLKITTSSVLTPNGNEIQGNGIFPDIDLEESFESFVEKKTFYEIENSHSSNILAPDDKNFQRDLELYITYKILKTKSLSVKFDQ